MTPMAMNGYAAFFLAGASSFFGRSLPFTSSNSAFEFQP